MGISRRLGSISAIMTAALIVLVIPGALAACARSSQAVSKAVVAGCAAGGASTTQGMLTQRACQAAGNQAKSVQVAYTSEDASLKVVVKLGGAVPDTDQEVSAAQELTKTICLREQQAMWKSGVTLKNVTVTVLGPTQDEYAEIVDGAYGSAVLNADAAARLDWASLSADSAWNQYDYAFLRPYYVLFD